MEPQPSSSRGFVGGGGGRVILGGRGGSGPLPSSAVMHAKMPGRVHQTIAKPNPGPPGRPSAQPVIIPDYFIVPPEEMLPHQVKSGIDIVNLFKLLNALQNRIALACGQHQVGTIIITMTLTIKLYATTLRRRINLQESSCMIDSRLRCNVGLNVFTKIFHCTSNAFCA